MKTRLITYRIRALILMSVLMCSSLANSQVSIVSANLVPVNITPMSISQAMVMNSGAEAKVIVEAFVMNSSGEKLLSVRSAVITLKPGMNNLPVQQTSFTRITYSSSNQGNYVKSKN